MWLTFPRKVPHAPPGAGHVGPHSRCSMRLSSKLMYDAPTAALPITSKAPISRPLPSTVLWRNAMCEPYSLTATRSLKCRFSMIRLALPGCLRLSAALPPSPWRPAPRSAWTRVTVPRPRASLPGRIRRRGRPWHRRSTGRTRSRPSSNPAGTCSCRPLRSASGLHRNPSTPAARAPAGGPRNTCPGLVLWSCVGGGSAVAFVAGFEFVGAVGFGEFGLGGLPGLGF